MDAVRNPFAPGAGSQPPELAGRQDVLSTADVALQRLIAGRHDRSQMLIGLRGVGKTVLLNKIEQIAMDHQFVTSFIEAPEGGELLEYLAPKLLQVLRQLSATENAKQKAEFGIRALQSLASVFKLNIGGAEFSVEPAPGIADSGILDQDLPDVFVKIGQAAESANRGWAIFIDEIQYLSKDELSALIVSIHRLNQLQLPIILFGAGLPQVAKLSGDAKSYAERLFHYPPIGPLAPADAKDAIANPIDAAGEEISIDALDLALETTMGYPYFLQEWGFQIWNLAENSPINVEIVEQATPVALARLDEGFFKVRFDRLTPKEKEYVIEMARMGSGPYRSADIADRLGEKQSTLAPRRAKIISKGMIYSPAHGDIDFTVPMFDSYINRTVLN